MTLPIVMTKSGLTPIDPQTIRDNIDAYASSVAPGYTSNLPASLIEDICSTNVGAVLLCDLARIELVNSLTPYGANEFILNQLGAIYGVKQGIATNASVYVQFTGDVGYVIPVGFTVSDGVYQYSVKNGGIINSGGTVTLYCVATVPGDFAIPANTVNQLITSVPTTVTLSCTNPTAGTPATPAESMESYRSRVLDAGIASSTGSISYLKTRIKQVSGVSPLHVSVQTANQTQYKVMVGGGDPYDVAYAIFRGWFDIANLVGSEVDSARDVTVTISDYPDNYNIKFVNPVSQTVNVIVAWNTYNANFTSDGAIAGVAQKPISEYIQNLPIGYAINIDEMKKVFLDATVDILPNQYMSKIDFEVLIDNVSTPPTTGTNLVKGDIEGYFTTFDQNIVIQRG